MRLRSSLASKVVSSEVGIHNSNNHKWISKGLAFLDSHKTNQQVDCFQMLLNNKRNLLDCFHKDNHNSKQVQVDYLEIHSKVQLQLEEQAHYLVIHSNSSKDKHHKIYLVISRNRQLLLKEEIHYFSNKDNKQQLLLQFHLVAHNSS